MALLFDRYSNVHMNCLLLVQQLFSHQWGIQEANPVPIDKFKEKNCMRAQEYLEALSLIAPHKLRFGDEKLIKGVEVYCRRTRRNVLTGKLSVCMYFISHCSSES